MFFEPNCNDTCGRGVRVCGGGARRSDRRPHPTIHTERTSARFTPLHSQAKSASGKGHPASAIPNPLCSHPIHTPPPPDAHHFIRIGPRRRPSPHPARDIRRAPSDRRLTHLHLHLRPRPSSTTAASGQDLPPPPPQTVGRQMHTRCTHPLSRAHLTPLYSKSSRTSLIGFTPLHSQANSASGKGHPASAFRPSGAKFLAAQPHPTLDRKLRASIIQYCYTDILLYCYTAILIYCYTSILIYFYTTIRLYY